MDSRDYETLDGGNMNKPLKRNNLIYKDVTEASDTIHNLLLHVSKKGLDWVPKSFGIDTDNKHILSYIEGFVPDENPSWLWGKYILTDVAVKLRQWHDATEDFSFHNSKWLLSNDEPNEVICHSDFAPYNCVFENERFKGLIDFDVCSPGSRIWDISYAVYRFVPLLPQERSKSYYEISPFSVDNIMERLNLFLRYYSMDETEYLYDTNEVIRTVKKRLTALSEWSKAFGEDTGNNEIVKHSEMYSYHAHWVTSLLI